MSDDTRKYIYFVADVHLGLSVADPAERENRFLDFLSKIDNPSTKSVYLLGDIWDFWYEYHDVVPKQGARVVARLIALMDHGVEVYFIEGNHDIWTYSFFEELGIKKLQQPAVAQIGGKTFCLGHGDCIGGAAFGYRLMIGIFHSRVAQFLFSTLHPRIAFRFGLKWSNSNRRKHTPYHFRGSDEPLFKFAEQWNSGVYAGSTPIKADYFVFGHFHDSVNLALPSGGRLLIVKDWISGGQPCLKFSVDGSADPEAVDLSL